MQIDKQTLLDFADLVNQHLPTARFLTTLTRGQWDNWLVEIADRITKNKDKIGELVDWLNEITDLGPGIFVGDKKAGTEYIFKMTGKEPPAWCANCEPHRLKEGLNQ